jgi:predicted RNA-binding protein (virulence factor B family)
MTDDTRQRSGSPAGGFGAGAARGGGGRWEGRRDRALVRVNELGGGPQRSTGGAPQRRAGGGRAARQDAPVPGAPRLRAGDVVTLDVAREVPPNGYFLTDGHQDVLLHYSETTGPVRIGEPVDVFLYHDTEDRLAATMRRPKLLRGEVGLLEVADIHSRYGVFLEMGLGRNLLLPYSELPELKELRPQVGDAVFVTLANDRQGRLVAKLAGEAELAPKCFHAPSDWRNRWVDARVYKPLQMGTFVICEGGVLGFGVIGFIPAPERMRLLRLGEQVRVRVTFVREDGRVNLSLRQPKELSRNEDADRLLEFLKARPNGAMPYSDETPADVIAAKFGISKAAFKRALGKLMRENAVYQKGNWTYLVAAGSSEAGGPPQPEA